MSNKQNDELVDAFDDILNDIKADEAIEDVMAEIHSMADGGCVYDAFLKAIGSGKEVKH